MGLFSKMLEVGNAILNRPPLPVPMPTAVLTRERFVQLTNDIVIPDFESGYYHPDMLLHMNANDKARLAASGETMFGLDRKAGGALAMYPEWKIFWAVIDVDRAKNPALWKHYYLGGEVAKQLRELAAKIMYQWFTHLSAVYLKGNAIEKIAADDRLVIHFSYAAWNGPGWFERFAKALNSAKGTREQIYQTAINARLKASSEAIRNAGVKMVQVFKTKGFQ